MNIDTSQFDAIGRDLRVNAGKVGAKAAMAFRKTILDIERTSKELAPVDTGALENSIGHEIRGDGRFGRMEGEVGGTVDYDIWQEIGTSTQPGKPHHGPAFDQHVPRFIAAVEQLGAEIL